MNLLNGIAVLVTGGAGFIGSHLVETLVSHGAHVTILDNLSTGSLENIEKVMDKVTFLHGDINNPQDCTNACQAQEIIFHLAAKISVAESMKDPQSCYETNVLGTLHMLQAAVTHKVKRFLFSSSAAVYGPQNTPCHENMICKPESTYGHSKLIGELLCKDFWQQHNLETICLRYFNVYGERQNPNGAYAAVVAAFTQRMKDNEPITIFGDGTQMRDFISVQKVAQANIELACTEPSLVAGQVFNVASGKSITLLELIENLKKTFTDYTQEVLFQPARQGDIKYSSAVCEKLEKVVES